jgi:hypothetical protein
MSTGAKEGKSSTGRVWAARFHHVTTRSHFAGILLNTVSNAAVSSFGSIEILYTHISLLSE